MNGWLTRDEAAAICDITTERIEYHRKRGRIAARKELRTVEFWNPRAHAFILYKKKIWVYCPDDVRSLRVVLDFNKERRCRARKAVSCRSARAGNK